MSEPRNETGRVMSERIPCRDMAEALERMADSKRFWLTDFSRGRRKRPDHEIAQKRQELTVLQQAAFDYRAQRSGVAAKDASTEGEARR